VAGAFTVTVSRVLTATDLELGIRCSCPAKVKKEGAGTVPARKLLDYTRLLPDVAGPGALAVNPQRRNSPIASAAASKSVLAVTSTL